MDLLKDLGALALGTRLKRLSDRLMQDGIRIYKETGIAFEPKWFAVYYFLLSQGPSAVTDIAKGLGITHPSVNQIAREMIQAGLLAAYKDRSDKRRRVLALTAKGKEKRDDLEKIWQDVRSTLQELLDETQVDFLGYIETMERSLDKRSFQQRFQARHYPGAQDQGIRIVGFLAEHIKAFRQINEEWILEYFEIEASDRLALDDPEKYIIKPGGEILFAIESATNQVWGTCALIHRGDGLVELAKMGVSKVARGKGVGKLLAYSAVKRAREMGFNMIYLETNSRLAPALGLYRQIGFVRKPVPKASDYSRADVYMELLLNEAAAK